MAAAAAALLAAAAATTVAAAPPLMHARAPHTAQPQQDRRAHRSLDDQIRGACQGYGFESTSAGALANISARIFPAPEQLTTGCAASVQQLNTMAVTHGYTFPLSAMVCSLGLVQPPLLPLPPPPRPRPAPGPAVLMRARAPLLGPLQRGPSWERVHACMRMPFAEPVGTADAGF